MTTLTVKPRNKKELLMIEKILEALKVDYVPTEEEELYNPEFVAKILQGDEDSRQGKSVTIALEDLWK
jgi:hypothetical protein